MRTAVGYIRVSTTGQADDGISLDAQQSKIEAWAFLHEFELLDVYIDAGISGSRISNRPALQKALDAVTSSGGALIVYSLSRLARSTKDTISISERLDKADADLVSLSERIDTTSAAGRMVFRMLAVLNEFERDLVSERTTAAMAHLRSQGKCVGQVPFGFDLMEDGETLVENPDEQQAIESIGALRLQGYSLRAIAASLETQRVPTKAGNHRWTHTAVNSILKRSARLGSKTSSLPSCSAML